MQDVGWRGCVQGGTIAYTSDLVAYFMRFGSFLTQYTVWMLTVYLDRVDSSPPGVVVVVPVVRAARRGYRWAAGGPTCLRF
jgi:hypothetical protein